MTKNIIIAILVAVIGFTMSRETEVVMVEVTTKWCFYAEYEDIGSFNAVQSPQRSFISIKGSKYQVFVPCEHIWVEDDNT